MSTQIRPHYTMLVLGLTAVVMLSACSGRRIMTVVEDQTFQPGPPPAPAVEATQGIAPLSAPPGAPAELTKPAPSPALLAEPPGTKSTTPAGIEEPREAPAELAKPAPPTAGLPESPGTEPATQGSMGEPRIEIPSSPPSAEEVPVVEQPIAPPPPPKPALPPSQPAAELSDIFFDFDQFTVRDEARSGLEASARLLKAQSDQAILIEGHCDERGTSAYNLVLGERRARAVKQYLQDLGVAPSEIQITSYGNERPFCMEHSEACWELNRRAHFSKR